MDKIQDSNDDFSIAIMDTNDKILNYKLERISF
jgi:hypothetical protein